MREIQEKLSFLSLLFILVIGCATTPTSPLTRDEDDRNIFVEKIEPIFIHEKFFFPFLGKRLLLTHFSAAPNYTTGEIIPFGAKIGRIEPFPATYSQKNDETLKKAELLYERKAYREAVELLLTVDKEENQNIFYLYILGRATFWIQEYEYRQMSRGVYRHLMKLLKESQPHSEDEIHVDLRFLDAYLKYGILHLDFKDYQSAVVELLKFLTGGTTDAKATELALSYITESYYFIGNKDLNNYFYMFTRAAFPQNTYVEKYYLNGRH